MANGPLLPAIRPEDDEELRDLALRELGPGLLAPRTPALGGANGQMLPAVNGDVAPTEAAAPVLPAIAEGPSAAAPPDMLPAVQELDGPSALERLAPWALGGLAVGSAIRNRDIAPIAQAGAGFLAGRQGAEDRRSEAEAAGRKEAREEALAESLIAQRERSGQPNLSIGPQGKSLTGLRLEPGSDIEQRLAELSLSFEDFPTRENIRVMPDAQGGIWRVNVDTGEAERIEGPAGRPPDIRSGGQPLVQVRPDGTVETIYSPPEGAGGRIRGTTPTGAQLRTAAARDVDLMLRQGNFQADNAGHFQVLVQTLQSKYPDFASEIPGIVQRQMDAAQKAGAVQTETEARLQQRIDELSAEGLTPAQIREQLRTEGLL